MGAKIKRFFRKYGAGYLFILPVVLGILIFTLWPMISSLYYSLFRRYTVVRPPMDFDPLFNYKKLLFNDEYVWKALGVTFTYSLISIPLTMILSFLLAMFLNQKFRGVGVMRLVVYLPVIIPVTISGLLWRNFFDVEYGLANKILTEVLNLPPSPFFSSAKTSMATLIFMGLWSLGGSMILWLAALRGVPEAQYDAAKIDGAGWWTRTIHITVPMCTPTILYNTIMGVINSLQMFGGVFALTGGTDGEAHSLLFYVMKVYYDAFGGTMEMAYACAESWLLFVIIAVLTFLVFKTSKWVFYAEDY